MKHADIYLELAGLANSLDDHVTTAEVAAKLRELADQIDGPHVGPAVDEETLAAIHRVRAFQKHADDQGFGRG